MRDKATRRLPAWVGAGQPRRQSRAGTQQQKACESKTSTRGRDRADTEMHRPRNRKTTASQQGRPAARLTTRAVRVRLSFHMNRPEQVRTLRRARKKRGGKDPREGRSTGDHLGSAVPGRVQGGLPGSKKHRAGRSRTHWSESPERYGSGCQSI